LGGVTGFSHLEYIFAAAKVLKEKPDGRCERDEIIEAIKESAERRIQEWFAKVGWREQRRPGKIIEECLRAMKKWNLIDLDENIVKAKEEILLIGSLLEKSQVNYAKKRLLNAILTSRKEKPFHPSNLLMKIRNSGPMHKIRLVFRGKKEMSKEIPFVTESGMVPDDGCFVKEILRTNFRAIDVIRDWGVFFELLDYTSLESKYLNEISKKYGYQREKIERPRHLLFLTVRIASLSELKQAILENPENLGINDFSQRCIREILQTLNFRNGNVTFERIVEKSLEMNLDVISDGPEAYGYITKDNIHLIDPQRTYVIMRPKINLEDFKRCVEESHRKITGGRPIIPVWVGDLAETVCANLRIPESLFRKLLLELKVTGAVVFHKAPMFIAGVKRRRRLPIVDETGRSYQQVSLV